VHIRGLRGIRVPQRNSELRPTSRFGQDYPTPLSRGERGGVCNHGRIPNAELRALNSSPPRRACPRPRPTAKCRAGGRPFRSGRQPAIDCMSRSGGGGRLLYGGAAEIPWLTCMERTAETRGGRDGVPPYKENRGGHQHPLCLRASAVHIPLRVASVIPGPAISVLTPSVQVHSSVNICGLGGIRVPYQPLQLRARPTALKGASLPGGRVSAVQICCALIIAAPPTRQERIGGAESDHRGGRTGQPQAATSFRGRFSRADSATSAR
jgi:hypothetical protein